MHKLAPLVTLTIALVSTASAQGTAPPPPPPPPASANWLFGTPPAPAQRADSAPAMDVVTELFKGITLSPAQTAAIDSLRERYIVQYQVFTPGVRPNAALRQRVRELVRRELHEVRALLTPDQQAVWDLNVADVLAQLASGMPELFPTIPKADVSTPVLSGSSQLLTALLQGIALTPDQQVRVDSIRVRYRGQAPVVPLGTTPDSATVRQLRDLSRQTLDDIRALLSPQQQQVWDRNLTQAFTSNMRVGP
jgi:hypothetical protein